MDTSVVAIRAAPKACMTKSPSYLSLIPQLYYTTAAMLLRSPGLPFTSSLPLLSVSVTSHSSSGLGVGLL